MAFDIAGVNPRVLCKNKNTGEISICSCSCENITESKISGVCVCEPVGKCGRSFYSRLDKEGFEKLNAIQRKFAIAGKEFFKVSWHGLEILEALPLLKGDRLAIPNSVERFSYEAEQEIAGIKYLEVPPSLKDVNGFICDHSDELEELTFNEGFKELMLCTLPHYKKLKKIYLPRSLEKIDDGELFVELIRFIFAEKTFYVHKDSYAEEYMKSKGLNYEVI